jgi:hypothetical protein
MLPGHVVMTRAWLIEQVDQCYVLCDAGGGTVDVVSYQVKRSDSLVELEKASTPRSKYAML